MKHISGTVLSPTTVRCDGNGIDSCGEEFPTVPHPEPDHWESPLLMAHIERTAAQPTTLTLRVSGGPDVVETYDDMDTAVRVLKACTDLPDNHITGWSLS